MDLGTCRKEDLFITDANYRPIENFSIIFHDNKLYQYEEEVNNLIDKFNNNIKEEEEKVVKEIKKMSWDDLL